MSVQGVGIKMIGQNRILDVLLKLIKGERLTVKQLAAEYDCSEKTLQRDFQKIRLLFAPQDNNKNNFTLHHDKNVYYLEQSNQLDQTDILILLKIVISSRSLRNDELISLIETLTNYTTPESKKLIEKSIKSELTYYQPLLHGKSVTELIKPWIAAIEKQQAITATYKAAGKTKEKELTGIPLAIMFNGSYFYLRIYLEYSEKIKNFRLDRFNSNILSANHNVTFPQNKKLEPGLVRARSLNMFTPQPDSLLGFSFNYWGSEEHIRDTFSNAVITKEATDDFIQVEVQYYAESAVPWILSQGSLIQVTKPISFVNKIKAIISRTNQRYQ